MKKTITGFLTILALSGCVQPMTKTEVSRAVYEQLPDDYRDQVKNLILPMLKDPDSAKYNFFEPRKSYSQTSRRFGYVVPVGVNAKNSYGGYTGFEMYYFVYQQKNFRNVTDGVSFGEVKWSDDVK